MPTYAEIDSVRRELTDWPITMDGVRKDLDKLLSNVDGVQREIFGVKKYKWEKRAVWTFFGTTGKAESIYPDTVEVYYGNYVESGTYSFDNSNGAKALEGKYLVYEGGDYYIKSAYTGGPRINLLKVANYTEGKGEVVLSIVESKNPDAYPENGKQGNYWYVRIE